jgi:V8-like Glu-specific endopeptidase
MGADCTSGGLDNPRREADDPPVVRPDDAAAGGFQRPSPPTGRKEATVPAEASKPVPFSRWKSEFEARPARGGITKLAIRAHSLPLAGSGRRRPEAKLERSDEGVDLVVRGLAGVHVFGPQPETISLGRELRRVEPDVVGDPQWPGHLARAPVPAKLPAELKRPYFIPSLKRPRDRNWGEPTTVFSPDTRYTFSDTSYPWSTCGRVDTAAGWGSGVMVGPRHLLTASHVVNWGTGNTAGWLRFTPLSFDGSTPFGVAWASLIYWWNRANPGDGINAVECAFDYVVCILDRRLGDITGWMGSRGYSTSWDGGSYWGHIGYPGDMSGGTRPAFHGPGVMDSTFTQSLGGRNSFGIRHRNDVWPGQSGGPYFGWWAGQVGPHVVSTQSAQNWGGSTGQNTSGGGDPLPVLVRWGLDHNP